MRILIGYAVGFGTGILKDSAEIQRPFDTGGQFGIDIRDKGFVGKLTGKPARFRAAHSVTEYRECELLRLYVFDFETVLIFFPD